ncbi:hypothetical protein Z043_114590 [Scleropages formosus]|uniref:Guanylate kinase-like domain-containing protein n=1 Tax=Scleropages formosus TaxID=113540 RepID=A0A0P7UYR6_SCLFO|nr:hypothetical protein Z043_114590 [Scleropages formosus]
MHHHAPCTSFRNCKIQLHTQKYFEHKKGCWHTGGTVFSGQEENLIPYSLVEPVVVTSRRPVIFSPSVLSRGLIERLLQPADSGLDFNTCHPGKRTPETGTAWHPPLPTPLRTADQRDKRVFLLSPQSTETVYGIRVESIQDVISQDKHCLLELGVSSVEGLLRQGIYPIVIHIRPKDKKGRKFK